MKTRTNLPSALTSFIGRGSERTLIRTALRESRLITLTGIGGIGKTRLALRVGEQTQRAFLDGVFYVDLSAIPPTDEPDGDALYQAIAAALDLAPTTTPRGDIFRRIKGADLLLILDSCEHLLHACAQVITTLLSASPGLRILATSHRSLGVDGERRILLDPLSIPEEDTDPVVARAVDAVALFYDRAAAAGHALADDDATIQVVAGICRQFDGLPLPIELATETLRALSPEEILRQLRTDRFGPLAGGKRGGPHRQRSLLSELDFARSLCTDAERALWARLSVCSGGFDLQTAHAIAAANKDSAGKVLALIAGLVDRSILKRDDTTDPQATRYQFLETVRQYGLRQLDASGEGDLIRRRHADHFLTKAETATTRWLPDLPDDVLNLRDALTALESARPQDAVALVVALTRTQLTHDHRCQHHLADAVARALRRADASPAPLRARARAQASWLALWRGDITTSRQLLAQASADAADTTAGDAGLAPLLDFVHAAHAGLINLDPSAITALGRAQRDFATAPGGRDTYFAVAAAVLAALTAAAVGTRDDSVAAGAACAPVAGTDPSVWASAWCLLPIGFIESRDGSPEHARSILRGVVNDLWQHRDLHTVSWALLVLASIAAYDAQAEDAARLLGIVHAAQSVSGDDLTRLGLFARIRAEVEHAARDALGAERYDTAYSIGVTSGIAEGIAFVLDGQETPGRTRRGIAASHPLSAREFEITELIAKGRTNKEMASILVIGDSTVASHIAHIKQKLNVTSRTEIAAWHLTHSERSPHSGPAKAVITHPNTATR